MTELRERRSQGIAEPAIDQGQQSGIAEPSIDQGQQSSNSGFYQALLHGGDYLHASDTQASAGLYENPLPCCGCGIGWFLYVLFISLSSPLPLFLLASTIIPSFPFFHYWAWFRNHPSSLLFFPFTIGGLICQQLADFSIWVQRFFPQIYSIVLLILTTKTCSFTNHFIFLLG